MTQAQLTNPQDSVQMLGHHHPKPPHIINVNPVPMPIVSPIQPVVPGDIWTDWEKYLEAMSELSTLKAQIKKLAASLKTMKNAMWGIQEVMGAIMNYQGAQVAAFSEVQNMDSDMQSAFGSAESNFNGMSQGGAVTKNGVDDAKKLLAFIKEMEDFIKEQEGEGKNSAFGNGALQNLQNAINTIKTQFGSSWGNPGQMAIQARNWTDSSSQGQFSPQLKAVQYGFQQLNSSTGALGASTTTQLQFLTNVYKQLLGIDETFIDAYTKITGQMAQKLGQSS